METYGLENTCSMLEIGSIGSETSLSKLESTIRRARDSGRKAIIANLNAGQHREHGATFVNAGFRCVGKYYGNSNQYVYVYLYGVQRLTPVTKKR